MLLEFLLYGHCLSIVHTGQSSRLWIRMLRREGEQGKHNTGVRIGLSRFAVPADLASFRSQAPKFGVGAHTRVRHRDGNL